MMQNYFYCFTVQFYCLQTIKVYLLNAKMSIVNKQTVTDVITSAIKGLFESLELCEALVELPCICFCQFFCCPDGFSGFWLCFWSWFSEYCLSCPSLCVDRPTLVLFVYSVYANSVPLPDHVKCNKPLVTAHASCPTWPLWHKHLV